MADTWRLAWGRGEVTLDGDRLAVVRGRRGYTIDLATARATLARWAYSDTVVVGAVIAFDTEPPVTIAGAHTPRGVRYTGVVRKPTAILSAADWKQLYDRLGDRVTTTPRDPDETPVFELAPKTSRQTVAVMALLPLGALAMMVPTAISEGSPGRAVGSAIALVVAAAIAWWFMRRTGPLRLTVDGDELTLVGGARTWHGHRNDLRGEAGHVATYSRYGTSKTAAIAFHVGDRRVLVQSMEATAVRGPALRGLAYMLPGDELDRLQRLLRLR
jgi:hypothetical protein